MAAPKLAPAAAATAGPPAAAEPAARGSRRRRLWDLPPAAHCPVLGVCLPIQALRRLFDRRHGPRPAGDDHALHRSAVAACGSRGPLAEDLQRELDRRHLLALRRAAQAKTTEALAAWWDAALDGPDTAGAFWAVLTHPRCTPAITECVLGHMHMLQHQAGMAVRVDLARFEALIDENAVLARALGQAQARAQRLATEQQRRQATLEDEAVRLRGRVMAQALQIDGLQDRLAALQQAVPSLPARAELAAELTAQTARAQQLERQCLQARHEAELAQRRVAELAAALAAHLQPVAADGLPAEGAPADPADPCEPTDLPAPDARLPTVRLDNQAVLCVGGRSSAVPLYRLIVERSGARFIHHDGGQQDSSARLDATLAAADLVICQTGCISHNAYWRVKDHCRRTGKRCVFVETPSSAGLKRALVQLAPDSAASAPAGPPAAG